MMNLRLVFALDLVMTLDNRRKADFGRNDVRADQAVPDLAVQRLDNFLDVRNLVAVAQRVIDWSFLGAYVSEHHVLLLRIREDIADGLDFTDGVERIPRFFVRVLDLLRELLRGELVVNDFERVRNHIICPIQRPKRRENGVVDVLEQEYFLERIHYRADSLLRVLLAADRLLRGWH